MGRKRNKTQCSFEMTLLCQLLSPTHLENLAPRGALAHLFQSSLGSDTPFLLFCPPPRPNSRIGRHHPNHVACCAPDGPALPKCPRLSPPPFSFTMFYQFVAWAFFLKLTEKLSKLVPFTQQIFFQILHGRRCGRCWNSLQGTPFTGHTVRRHPRESQLTGPTAQSIGLSLSVHTVFTSRPSSSKLGPFLFPWIPKPRVLSGSDPERVSVTQPSWGPHANVMPPTVSHSVLPKEQMGSN